MDLVYIANWRSGHNFIKNNLMSWKNFDNCFEIENDSPENFEYYCQKRKFNIADKRIVVISTRDLLNWFASLYIFGFKGYTMGRQLAFKTQDKHLISRYYLRKYEDNNTLLERLNAWNGISKEVFNETNYFEDGVKIAYEKFKNEKTYRQNICEQIGGIYNEDNLNKVPRNGAHSTWDNRDFQFKGTEMKTEERYLKMLEHEEAGNWMKVLSKVPHVLDTYERNFELIDTQKEVLEKIRKLN